MGFGGRAVPFVKWWLYGGVGGDENKIQFGACCSVASFMYCLFVALIFVSLSSKLKRNC